MAISTTATATAILILHTLQHLLTAVFLYDYYNSLPKMYQIGSLTFALFIFTIHVVVTTLIFAVTSLVNYLCLPSYLRVTWRRHLVTTILIAPLLSQITGRGLGMIGNNTYRNEALGIADRYHVKPIAAAAAAAACYEQLDVTDPTVLTKGIWCELLYGIPRGVAEQRVEDIRTENTYIYVLVAVCLSMRDVEHYQFNEGGIGGVCWMGVQTGDFWEKEGRNTASQYFWRGMWDCQEKFGLEPLLQ